MSQNRFFRVLLILILGLFSQDSFADSRRDVEVITKVVQFINNGPVGQVDMPVIYDPNNKISVQHANDVLRWVGDGVGSKVKLKAKKVPVASISSITSQIIFLTKGTSSAYAQALSKAKLNRGITVSTDIECLGKGCVLVVKTTPRVDILVSTALTKQVGAKFASAFSMMITKR